MGLSMKKQECLKLFTTAVIISACLIPSLTWGNPSESASNVPKVGTPYEVPKPKTPTEIARYNQFVNAFNEGSAFRKAGQQEQALASYEKAYAAWPSLEGAEVILGVLDSTHQWEALAQRLTQFPQTPAYKPLRDFYTASCV